jgi:hypothetical protein
MSMPIKAIDRLFDRLGLTYGASWSRKWDGMPINEVKSLWAHELAFYSNNLSAVAWALENLPENCPNVIEFKNLCRKAPEAEKPRLPEPKANPERLKAELAKLMAPAKQAAEKAQFTDGRDWARRIIARHDAGDKLNAVTLRFAKEALA